MHISSTPITHSGPPTILSISPSLFQFNCSGLEIRPVASYREENDCNALVHRMYAWRGYRLGPPSKHSSRDQLTLGAWQDGELAATLTVARDLGNNLLSEALYPTEITELRAKARSICEYSRLAIDPIFSSGKLLGSFFQMAYNLAHTHFRVSDAVVEINPRHRRFYEREMAFSLLGSLRVCPRVDAPALLMHRNMAQPCKARPKTSRNHLQLPDLPIARHPITP
jgi:hypothetical protein